MCEFQSQVFGCGFDLQFDVLDPRDFSVLFYDTKLPLLLSANSIEESTTPVGPAVQKL